MEDQEGEWNECYVDQNDVKISEKIKTITFGPAHHPVFWYSVYEIDYIAILYFLLCGLGKFDSSVQLLGSLLDKD